MASFRPDRILFETERNGDRHTLPEGSVLSPEAHRFPRKGEPHAACQGFLFQKFSLFFHRYNAVKGICIHKKIFIDDSEHSFCLQSAEMFW